MLELRKLSAWHGRAQALFDVSLSVDAGELVVLRGLNGAGKSTLLQAIMGLIPDCQGDVLWQGCHLNGLLPHRRARAGLGYVPESRRLFPDLSVRENLLIASRGATEPALRQCLQLFPVLADMMERPAASMSGGEQQMLALARTLMTGPRLLLLDEPCEGISPVLVDAIQGALVGLRGTGVAMLVAEQNEALAQGANRVLELAGGRLGAAEHGSRRANVLASGAVSQ